MQRPDRNPERPSATAVEESPSQAARFRPGFRLGAVWRLIVPLACLTVLTGCSPFSFSPTQASALSREQLLKLADQGQGDHLFYAGSDSSHHFLVDTRKGKQHAYKIEIQQLPLRDTFRQGQDSPYIVYPHMIEGELLGERPREIRGVNFETTKRPEPVRP